ncbi:hypothetical protein MRB53_039948 [Persea americana]|nr:hypothetical protein MRB53_039948 [Persea americana]
MAYSFDEVMPAATRTLSLPRSLHFDGRRDADLTPDTGIGWQGSGLIRSVMRCSLQRGILCPVVQQQRVIHDHPCRAQ